MKIKLTILTALISIGIFAQDKPNFKVTILYKNYKIPFKINQIEDTLNLDYSKPEDILKSFYSANSESWVKNLYISKPSKIVQDNKHFEGVKQRNRNKNYAQLESIIQIIGEKEILFMKYSMVIEDFPFPLIAILSLEKHNNRWYIQDQIGQEVITTVLANFEPIVLKNIISGKDNTLFERNIIAKTTAVDNTFSFKKLTEIYLEYLDKADKVSLIQLRDKRLIGEGSFGVKAEMNSNFEVNEYIVERLF